MENIKNILEITSVLGFSLRLIVAIILGMLIGFERQWTKHQAGIMTNVIVCVGAYAYTAFAFLVNQDNTDFTRIAAQVVCGIGFLGAGLILRDGTNVRGLSTAATIWSTAAVGILCTIDNLLFAVLVAGSIVLVHLVLHPLSGNINRIRHYNSKNEKQGECIYKISITCREDVETEIRAHLMKKIKEEQKLLLHNLESNETDDGNEKIKAYVSLARKSDDVVENILSSIGKDEGIIRAGWQLAEE